MMGLAHSKIFLLLFFVASYSHVIFAQTLQEKEWIVEGNNFYLNKEFDKAKTVYSKVLATTPSNAKANYNLGNTYYHLKDYKKATTHYDRASKSSIDKIQKAHAFHNLGNSYMQQHEYQKAIDAYKNSLRNNPKDNETRYNFALAKKLLNNEEKNDQKPPELPKPTDYAKKMKAKADSLSTQGEFSPALEIMKQALAKDSTVAHFQNYMDKLNEIILLDTIKIK